MQTTTLIAEERGFDTTDSVRSLTDANMLKATLGVSFICRYVPHDPLLTNSNLTATELGLLLGAGLKVLVVQRPPAQATQDTQANAKVWGKVAGEQGLTLHLPAGSVIFVDVEGIGAGVDAGAFVTDWAAALKATAPALLPGLYYGTGVSAELSAQLERSGVVTDLWAGCGGAVARGPEDQDQSLPAPKPVDGYVYDLNQVRPGHSVRGAVTS